MDLGFFDILSLSLGGVGSFAIPQQADRLAFYTNYFAMIADSGIESARAIYNAIPVIQVADTSTYTVYTEAVNARNVFFLNLRASYDNIFSNAFNTLPMEKAFQGLAQYILESTGSDIDTYLSDQEITVPETYANLSEIYGDPISTGNVE